MTYSDKVWKDSPDHTTPLSAAALNDWEARIKAETDALSVLAEGTGVQPESYGAVGDGSTDDTTALVAAFATGENVRLRPGKTYLHRNPLYISAAGQSLDGGGATLKRAAQAVTTTATPITSGVTTAITVAATSGGSGASAWSIQAGDHIVIEKSGTYDTVVRTVQSVVGNVVTVTVAFGISSSGTTNVRHGWNQLIARGAYGSIENVVLDGNSANWSWGRWEHTAAVTADAGASYLTVRDCVVKNQYGDGFSAAEYGGTWENNVVRDVKGRGIVLGGYQGAPGTISTKVMHNRFINCNGDSAVGASDGTGSIDFSQGGPSSLIHGNYIDGGIDGIGSLRSGQNSEVTITDNEFWNLTGLALDGVGSNTLDVTDVRFSGNRCYGAGITVNRGGGAGVSRGWTISDNLIVGASIKAHSLLDADVHDNTITCDALPALRALQLTATAVVGGGSFSAATYYYKITAYNATGSAEGSAEVSAAVVANGSVTLTWVPVPGATGYKIYRATSAGGENGATSLVTTITSATTVTYTDTGAATTTGACPSTNTSKPITVDLITLGSTGGGMSGTVHDNTLVGGRYAVQYDAACSDLRIAGNVCKAQYSGGVHTTTTGLVNVVIDGNHIVNDATAAGSNAYSGITPRGDTVTNNRINHSAGGGTGIGPVTAGAPVIRGNVINGGGSVKCIQINAGASNAIVENNQLDYNISDAGTNTRRRGNTISTGATSGVATLVAGTKDVNTGEAWDGTGVNVLLSVVTPGGTPGTLSWAVRAWSGITINSTSGTDTSTVFWQIVH